jgi:hypothetical protein
VGRRLQTNMRPCLVKVNSDAVEDQSIEAAERRREERSKFLHGEIIHRLRKAKTHAKTGDLGIAKMLEVGFKSTREIPANNVNAHASSGTPPSEMSAPLAA